MASKNGRIHTPEGTARYASLFTPRQRKDSKGVAQGEPKYQLTIIFDKGEDLSELEEACEAAAAEKFGAKWERLKEMGKLNWPVRSNKERVDDDGDPVPGFENQKAFHIAAKNGDRPGVVDENADPIMEKSEVYDGCRVRASVRAFAYDNESKGVAFILVNVQKLGEGKRLSGDPSAEEEFKPTRKSGKAAPSKRRPADDEDDDPLA